MKTLTILELCAVTGGKTETRNPDGSYQYHQDPTETCIDAMDKGAREKYPDNRWFFQRWWGSEDPNAGPRADYRRDSIRDACNVKPAS